MGADTVEMGGKGQSIEGFAKRITATVFSD
jgi:hypothetical protein